MTTSNLYQHHVTGQMVVDAIGYFPERTAIIWRDQSLTYTQMGELIGKLISLFKSYGLKRGDGIAQLSSNRPETICVIFAANIMGLRYTPLHPLGSVADHLFILKDSQVSIVIVESQLYGERGKIFLAEVPQLQELLTYGKLSIGTDILSQLPSLTAAPLVVEAQADDIGWIAYTGGTTGLPKGVVISHRSLSTNIMMTLSGWELPERPIFLAVTPVSHASGAIVPPVLIKGGTFVLAEGFTPEIFLDHVQKHHINSSFLVPTMIYALLDYQNLNIYDHSSLETVIYGAAAISPTRLKEAIETIGPVFMQLFGQTEAPNTICTLRKVEHDLTRPSRLSSCGRPMTGIEVKLLDEQGLEVSKGEPGEICVRGPLVMDGYWNREDETAEALAGGWLHTGDLATQDDEGFLYIVDRKKDMIVSGGFNVFPREVEDVLSAHNKISAVSVFGLADDKWGEKVVAAIVLKPQQTLDINEIKALVKEKKGAVYTPKEIHFMETLPVTALGKPDKKTLRKMFEK